jgi:hypothetical protein
VIPFLEEMIADVDLTSDEETAAGFTFRHARIPRDRADEYVARLHALALEFIAEPRAGDVEYGLYLAMFPTNRHIAPAAHDPADHDEETS